MTEMPESQNISTLLSIHLSDQGDDCWYGDAAIPAKKLKNALKIYGGETANEDVLALCDGTVFGSAKEGILITNSNLMSNTSVGTFTVPLTHIVGAESVGAWPEYILDIQCRDGSTHRISTTCFDKHRDGLVSFFNSLATVEADSDALPIPLPETPRQGTNSPGGAAAVEGGDTSVQGLNADLKLIGICPDDEFDDARDLFDAAFDASVEVPLLKGYCQYVGFNGREVDGIVVLTNQRLVLFSMEMGAKIVFVELTRRLLGKLPVPFLDSIVCFFLFSIPRSIYVALRGGKEKLIAHALAVKEHQLLSEQSPLRKVTEFDFEKLAKTVAQVDIGNCAGSGVLSRKFGVTFAPTSLTKAFSIPCDLVLTGHDSPEAFHRLLSAIRSTVSSLGIDYRLDAEGQKLTMLPKKKAEKIAA